MLMNRTKMINSLLKTLLQIVVVIYVIASDVTAAEAEDDPQKPLAKLTIISWYFMLAML